MATSVTNHQPPAANPQPPAKRLNPMKLKQMQDRCQELEEQIAALEAEIAGSEKELANFVSAEETMRVSALADQRRSELSALLAEWEEVSEAVASQQA